MLFNSLAFQILVVITFALYYTPRLAKWQVQLLIIASLIFYSYTQPILLLLLLGSASINIFTSYRTAFSQKDSKKFWATLGVVSNLLILIFFKYSPLIGASLFAPSSDIGAFLLTIPLPIGISFFTFQGISLLVDVFTENHWKNDDIMAKNKGLHSSYILFFIAFFPQLVAGPIVKAHEFLPQIRIKKYEGIQWEAVFKYLVVGYFLKMVVADNIKEFTFWIEYPYFTAHSTITLIIMLIGYSCQIFADFAGYSLIAIGTALLFGYQLHDNFMFPYISTSFSEFWRRWHISLSSFLREYLYIPLGGNRKGKVRTYINLSITMVLGGLWHGAAWSYAVWGAAHGLALALERLMKDLMPIKDNSFLKFARGILVFSTVTLAWLLFKLPDFDDVISYVHSILNNTSLPSNEKIITHILIYSSFIFIYHLNYLLQSWDTYRKIIQRYQYLFYGFMVFMILTNSGSSQAFIYFQF